MPTGEELRARRRLRNELEKYLPYTAQLGAELAAAISEGKAKGSLDPTVLETIRSAVRRLNPDVVPESDVPAGGSVAQQVAAEKTESAVVPPPTPPARASDLPSNEKPSPKKSPEAAAKKPEHGSDGHTCFHSEYLTDIPGPCPDHGVRYRVKGKLYDYIFPVITKARTIIPFGFNDDEQLNLYQTVDTFLEENNLGAVDVSGITSSFNALSQRLRNDILETATEILDRRERAQREKGEQKLPPSTFDPFREVSVHAVGVTGDSLQSLPPSALPRRPNTEEEKKKQEEIKKRQADLRFQQSLREAEKKRQRELMEQDQRERREREHERDLIRKKDGQMPATPAPAVVPRAPPPHLQSTPPKASEQPSETTPPFKANTPDDTEGTPRTRYYDNAVSYEDDDDDYAGNQEDETWGFRMSDLKKIYSSFGTQIINFKRMLSWYRTHKTLTTYFAKYPEEEEAIKTTFRFSNVARDLESIVVMLAPYPKDFPGDDTVLGKTVPFAGSGRTLKATPPTSPLEVVSDDIPLPPELDTTLPTTTIKVRCDTGRVLSLTVNETHTIQDLHDFINAELQTPRSTKWVLRIPPAIKFTDMTATVKKERLNNSTLVLGR